MEVPAAFVIGLYTELEGRRVAIWIDGGWAVDALLGSQTRPHQDLDIAVEVIDLQELKDYLISKGYREVARTEDKMWDLVLVDSEGHEVEVHSFSFSDCGEIVEEPYWDGYSRNSLTGTGYINGLPVRCVSLEQIVKTHDATKRKLKNSDYEDIESLTGRFGSGLFKSLGNVSSL